MKDGLDQEPIKLAVDAMKKVTGHFSHSHKKKTLLAKAQVFID